MKFAQCQDFFCTRYVFCCSYSHNVVPKGKYIAFVTTEAETDNPEAELKPGIDLLGPVEEIFFDTYDRYEPTNLDASDNCFISTVSITRILSIKLSMCCNFQNFVNRAFGVDSIVRID